MYQRAVITELSLLMSELGRLGPLRFLGKRPITSVAASSANAALGSHESRLRIGNRSL